MRSDQERAGASQGAALGVQEELGPVTPVEERPAACEVAPHGASTASRPSGTIAFLVALAERSDEPLLEVDAGQVEPDGLAHTQAGSVEELDERAVA